VAASLILGLSACGGSDPKIVARIGEHTTVSQAFLDHWMKVVVGGDYRTVIGGLSPDGLVSDPPRFASCASAARRIPEIAGRRKLTAAQVLAKCHQLNTAVKEQALSYVLSVLWSREEAAALGIPMPSQSEISSRLRTLVYDTSKNPADFRKVLSGQHRSVSDERFLLLRNILVAKIDARIKARAARLGGGIRPFYKLVLQNNAKWKAKTSCSPGYQAWECKQFKGEAKPPPAVVLEYFERGVA
jgi:hypothetical protein